MSQHFREPHGRFRSNEEVGVDLSNYETGIDTSKLTSKTSLVRSKIKVNKLGIDKLITVPTDLCTLSNIVDTDVIKKNVCMINW